MNRRQFVTAAAATLAAPAFAHAATPMWTCRATSGRMLAGVLMTANPTRHVDVIAGLRQQTGYNRPLLYASTDRLKMPFALAVIDHLSASNDIWFTIDRRAVAATSSDEPELQQLAAFLTGCAYGELSGTRHPLKRALIGALRDRTTLLV